MAKKSILVSLFFLVAGFFPGCGILGPVESEKKGIDAKIVVSDGLLETQTPIEFHASSQQDLSGSEYLVVWQFGEDSDTGISVTHAFENEGDHEVVCNVFKNEVLATSDKKKITLKKYNAPPAARITYPSGTFEIGEHVMYDATKSSDPEGSTLKYLWDFGNNTSGEKDKESKAYSSLGTYTVMLIVCDEGGKKDTVTVSIQVAEKQLATGNWSGGVVSFAVSNDRKSLTTLTLGPLSYSGGYCSKITNSTMTYNVRISLNSFYYNSTSDGTIRIDGTFHSSDSASGTWSFSKNFSSCGIRITDGGNWRARPSGSSGPTTRELITIPPLDTAHIPNDTINIDTTTPLSAPTLSSPANAALSIPLPVTLRWNAVANALTYRVQVSNGSSFSTSSVDDSSLFSNSKALANLDANSTYFWRVRAKNSAGMSPWSAIWGFTTIGLDTCRTDTFKTIIGLQHAGRMVEIPAGSFVDGSGVQASITYPFYIDTTEITEELYSAVMRQTASADMSPAKGVSWYQAVLFCNARSKNDGLDTAYSYSKVCSGCGQDNTISLYDNFDTLTDLACDWNKPGYRLPTEDEWELAARAGRNLENPTADGSINCCLANYNPNPVFGMPGGGCKGGLTPVASYPPNPYGVYDMAGNIIEWCWDVYASSRPAARTDYKGGQTGGERSARGGDYAYWSPASGSRMSQHPARKINLNTYFGFRCVRIIGTTSQ